MKSVRSCANVYGKRSPLFSLMERMVIMAFFDMISKKVTQAGAEAVKKTKEVAEATRLSLAIETEKRSLEDLYKELGRRYFEIAADAPLEALSDTVGRIRAVLDRIGEMEEQQRLLRGLNKCPQCGSLAEATAKFCPSCGAKLDPPRVEEEPAEAPADQAQKVCANCGAPLEPDAAFCTQCGTKAE